MAKDALYTGPVFSETAHWMQSSRVKMIALAIFLVILILFNLSLSKDQKRIPSEFEGWFSEREAATIHGDTKWLESLNVVLKLPREDGSQTVWQLTGSKDKDKAFRIAQLARESFLFDSNANIFGKNLSGMGPISLKIEGDGKTFETSFSASDIASNMPAQNMLKIMQLAAAEGTKKLE